MNIIISFKRNLSTEVMAVGMFRGAYMYYLLTFCLNRITELELK
jgi:hypothetical protein